MIYLVAVCLILYDFLFHCIGQYFSTNFKAVANLNVLKKLWHPRAAGKVEYSTLSHVLTFTSRQDWSNEKNIAREKIGRAVMNAAENSFACLKRSFKSATSCFQFYFLRRCYMTYFSDLSLCMEQKLSLKRSTNIRIPSHFLFQLVAADQRRMSTSVRGCNCKDSGPKCPSWFNIPRSTQIFPTLSSC